jgi:hypothetical protein
VWLNVALLQVTGFGGGVEEEDENDTGDAEEEELPQ